MENHNVHEETTYERNERENDEAEEKDIKFFFGDEVITPNGDIGKVTEIDGNSEERYRVDGLGHIGWFLPEELTKVV